MNTTSDAPPSLTHPITGNPLRLAHFNPDLQSRDDIKRGFIARQNLLNRMLEDLRRETGQSAPQHKLIVGQRGMGKTTLLHRFAHAVEEDAELGKLWQPLIFPEEQYNIARLSDFWLNCLDALGDALEAARHEDLADNLDRRRDALPKDEAQRSTAALALLLEQAQTLNKRLILLVDNLDIVLERLSEQDWEIRRIIAAEPRLLLVGATSRAIATAYEYGRAFYDFFRIHELKGLSEQETCEVLLTLSQLRQQARVEEILKKSPGRIRALHNLSGGNPRTVVLLYEVLETSSDGDARVDLERLLDLYTPLYKARFEEFPQQAQLVIDALAVHWDPMLAGELAEITRLPINTASAQLNRLEQQGLVEKVALYEEKKQGFQIAERFFNIWYLMRASRRVRRRLLWLVHFMETWYDAGALQKHALAHLNQEPDDTAREQYAEYGLALAQAIRHPPLRTALEHKALHALIDAGELHQLIDFSDLPPGLRDKKERMLSLRQLRERVWNAKLNWPGITAEEFWRLLGGSPLLSLNEKQRIVEELETLPPGELVLFIESLRQQEKNILSRYRNEEAVVCKLYEALAQGDMADAYDWEGARAIAVDEPYRRLPAIAVYACLYRNWPRFDLSHEELDKAQTCLQAMSEDSLLAAYGWNGLGNLFSDHLKRYEEAEQAYRQAIALDPRYAVPWNGLGNLLQDHLQRYQEAEQAYRQAIALDPQYVYPRIGLGNLLQYRLDRYEEAEQIYRQAIMLDQQNVYPWIALGNLLQYCLERYEDAEHAYRQAITIDPKSSLAWNGLGTLLQYRLQRYEEAEQSYRQSIAFDPQFALPWKNLGNLLQRHLQRYEEAEQAYWQVLQINQEFFWAKDSLLSLGNTWCNKKTYTQAEKLARRLTATFPEDPHAWLLLAESLAGKFLRSTDQLRVAEPSSKKRQQVDDILQALNHWFAASVALDETSDTERSLGIAQKLLRNLVDAGLSVAVRDQIEKTGLHERWRPLYEALQAAEAGTAEYLSRVAPEVRRPALDILRTIAPSLTENIGA